MFVCLEKREALGKMEGTKTGKNMEKNTCVVLVCIWNICGFIFFVNRVFCDNLLAIGFHPSAFSVKTEMVDQ